MMFQATQPCYTPLSLHSNVGADPEIFKGGTGASKEWDDSYIYLLWHSSQETAAVVGN